MSLNRIANITINLREPPIALASFSIPMMAALVSGSWDWGADAVREFAPQTYLTDLAAIGVTDSDDLYVSLVDLFSQTNKPEYALVGERATAVAQVQTIQVVGVVDGDYTITLNGNDYTFPASSNTATQIRDGLLALVNASTTDPVTAATVGGDSLSLTADEAGVPFTVSVASPGSTMTSTATTPNTGIPQDVITWRAERDDWYFLLEHSRTPGNLATAAAIIEALSVPKLFVGQTADALAQSGGSTADIGSVLAALGYNRTALVYDPNVDQFVDAALVGKVGPTAPGSNTWANQSLVSVAGFVPTSDTTLASKRYTWLEEFAAANFSMTQGGQVVSGQWIDLIIGRDFLKNLLQIRIVELLRNAPKVDYTDQGAQILGSVHRAALTEAASAPYNLIDPSTIVVNVPRVSSQSTTDRGNRHFPNITWSATLRGAVHTLDVTGDLAP